MGTATYTPTKTLPKRTATYVFISSAAAALAFCELEAYTGPQNLGEVLIDSSGLLLAPVVVGALAIGVQVLGPAGRVRVCASAALFICAAWIWFVVLGILALVAAMQAFD